MDTNIDPEAEFTQEEIDRYAVMQVISDNTDLPYAEAMNLATLIVEGLKEVPDDELDELEYYGRYGYTRTAPTCTDPECGCRDDLEDGDE